MQAVWIALIVAAPAAAVPVLVAWITGVQRRKEKKQDYARQDAVADRLAARQDAIAAKAAEKAELLLDANERVAHTAMLTQEKLDVIHVLVNSNMTAAMQAELTAMEEVLAMRLELAEDRTAAGQQPRPELLAAITNARSKVAELRSALSDRMEQTKVADARAERAGGK
jgi:hypothetical protein